MIPICIYEVELIKQWRPQRRRHGGVAAAEAAAVVAVAGVTAAEADLAASPVVFPTPRH